MSADATPAASRLSMFAPARARAGGPRSVGERLDAVEGAVELVLVAGEDARVGVLPDRVEAPAGRQGADAGRVARDPQRVGAEAGVVAGAQRPPARAGIEHRIAAGARLDRVGDVVDPDDHRALRQAVAIRAVGVVLEVDR